MRLLGLRAHTWSWSEEVYVGVSVVCRTMPQKNIASTNSTGRHKIHVRVHECLCVTALFCIGSRKIRISISIRVVVVSAGVSVGASVHVSMSGSESKPVPALSKFYHSLTSRKNKLLTSMTG